MQIPADSEGLGGQDAALENAFVYYNPVSVLTVDPPFGHVDGGEPITVTGTGFDTGSKVIFGSHAAVDVNVIDDETILAVTPFGDPGIVNVHVSNANGIGTLKKGFFYFDEPEITKLNPPSGPIQGGNQVTVSGSGFVGDVLVRIGGQEAEVISSTVTEAVISVPAGVEGPADVEIETEYGSALLPGG